MEVKRLYCVQRVYYTAYCVSFTKSTNIARFYINSNLLSNRPEANVY